MCFKTPLTPYTHHFPHFVSLCPPPPLSPSETIQVISYYWRQFAHQMHSFTAHSHRLFLPLFLIQLGHMLFHSCAIRYSIMILHILQSVYVCMLLYTTIEQYYSHRIYAFLCIYTCTYTQMYSIYISVQVWASVLKSYQLERLKVVVNKRPYINTAAAKCQARKSERGYMYISIHPCFIPIHSSFHSHTSKVFIYPYSIPGSLFPQRELKFLDMSVYFPKILHESHIRKIAEDIFVRGMRVKAQLRKGVWPHLVRVFHPDLELREDRELYLSKLRLIYDSLKGRLQSQNEGLTQRSRHLYDSIRRDAIRTDPTESFYHRHHNQETPNTPNPEASYLTRENVEKLVNIAAVYTLEHNDVSYTQGMTDLLSPILYVMEREDDAYIVFAAMVQRISDNFGMWCEGTLKKIERLRHLCDVLDPELSVYLAEIDEDAFALFFGMVLIECRREFSFKDSFHLMEVIWSAALCMQQKEDPFWSPPTPTVRGAAVRQNNRSTIQALSPEQDSIDFDLGTPTQAEWASFMSNQSLDVIQQVFGELQTYTAVPLTRSEYGSISHSFFHLSHTPPPQQSHASERHTSLAARQQMMTQSEHTADISTTTAEIHNRGCQATTKEWTKTRNNSAPAAQKDGNLSKEESNFQSRHTPNLATASGNTKCTQHTSNVLNDNSDDEESFSDVSSEISHDDVNPVSMAAAPTRGDVPGDTIVTEKRVRLSSSLEKEQLLSGPFRSRAATYTHGCNDKISLKHTKNETGNRNSTHNQCNDITPVEYSTIVVPNGVLKKVNSLSESDLTTSAPSSLPALKNDMVRTTTEMSDMSSVGSTNTSGGRGGLVASLEGDEEGGRGWVGEEGDGVRGGENGRVREGEDGFVDGRRRSEQADDDEHWIVVIPDGSETGSGTEERKIPVMSSDIQGSSGQPHPDGSKIISNLPTNEQKQILQRPLQNGGPSWDANQFVSTGADHRRMKDNLHHSSEVKMLPGETVVRRDSLTSPTSDVTLHNTTSATANNSNYSPSNREDTGSTIHEQVLTEDHEDQTLSPVQPFFDALETIANISRTTSPAVPGMRVEDAARPNSGVTAIVANLLSMEHSAPAVTRESSLSVPFSDSFPLFICLSIIIQQRARILHGNLDFVGLSVLLNTQAGTQNLQRTLRIARQLYGKYREYQRLCFGPRFSVYEIWLDNMESFFGGSHDPIHHNDDSPCNDQHSHEELQTTG